MLYVYSFCDCSANSAVEKYCKRFPTHRTPDCIVFSHVFNTLHECGTLPSAHVSSEQACQQHVEEHEGILEMVRGSPTTSMQRLRTRLCVSRTRVWRTLHEEGLYPYRPQQVQNQHPGDNAMHLEFCHWLRTNCQLLPLILSTDEGTCTRNGINNMWNSHRWSLNNPHGTVKTNFEHNFSIDVQCGMIDDLLIGLVILDDRITRQNYLDSLQNGLPEQLEDVPLATRMAAYFRHDRTPHYIRTVMKHLNDTFSNWIGHGNTIKWPPRLKSEVCRRNWIYKTNGSIT